MRGVLGGGALALAVVAAGTLGAGGIAASAVTRGNGPTWQKAILEPGARGPQDGQFAGINALSCPSRGNCLAGGLFYDRAGRQQAFTVSERNGTWRTPAELRGIYSVAPHGFSSITAAACGSAGNCVVGGIYASGTGYELPFVAREVAGEWQPATRVPGIRPVWDSQVTSASCVSAGNCLVGGYYSYQLDSNTTGRHAFVLAEVRGRWRSAISVPGVDTLSTAHFAATTALTCLSAGTCVAGGYYFSSPGPGAAADGNDFIVSEIKGVWSHPVTLADTGEGTVTSLSCSSAGNCAAALGVGDLPGFAPAGPAVATERNGSWGPAISVPRTSENSKFDVGATSVSCPAKGACVTGGGYWTGTAIQAFVVGEVRGRWQDAITFPRMARLNRGRDAQVTAIACASAGNCVAGGNYLDQDNNAHAFLISQTRGRWGSPVPVPGLPMFSTGAAFSALINAVACPAVSKCVAAGTYMRGVQEGFVTSER